MLRIFGRTTSVSTVRKIFREKSLRIANTIGFKDQGRGSKRATTAIRLELFSGVPMREFFGLCRWALGLMLVVYFVWLFTLTGDL
jgi:hypothetical protein